MRCSRPGAGLLLMTFALAGRFGRGVCGQLNELETASSSGPRPILGVRKLYDKLVPMKRTTVRFGRGFRVAIGNRRAQAATMTLPPGECEGGPDNRHRGADQWLFVESGTGIAIVKGKRVKLRAGSLLLIERGDRHEIRNTGRTALKTLNIYAPPAYSKSGDELPRGRE